MKNYKAFFVFFIVLAFSCSSVFAFAPLGIFAKSSVEPLVEESVEESTETLTESTETSTTSTEATTDSENLLIPYEDLAEMLDGKKWMTPKETEAFKSALSDAICEVGDNIATLKKDIATVQEDLAKELRTKFFVDFGLAFGYKEGIDLGFCGDFGIRKNSVIFKVGGQYMVGNTADVMGILSHDWSLRNCTIQTTIGYEW